MSRHTVMQKEASKTTFVSEDVVSLLHSCSPAEATLHSCSKGLNRPRRASKPDMCASCAQCRSRDQEVVLAAATATDQEGPLWEWRGRRSCRPLRRKRWRQCRTDKDGEKKVIARRWVVRVATSSACPGPLAQGRSCTVRAIVGIYYVVVVVGMSVKVGSVHGRHDNAGWRGPTMKKALVQPGWFREACRVFRRRSSLLRAEAATQSSKARLLRRRSLLPTCMQQPLRLVDLVRNSRRHNSDAKACGTRGDCDSQQLSQVSILHEGGHVSGGSSMAPYFILPGEK